MEIHYRDKRIERVCTDYNFAVKSYNTAIADCIDICIRALKAADVVEDLISNRIRRCHPLKWNYNDCYAMDLKQPYRLIFQNLVMRFISLK